MTESESYGQLRHCARCGEDKPPTEFYRASSNKKDGLDWTCASCRKAMHAARRATWSPERKKAWWQAAKQWKKDHPGRQAVYDRRQLYGISAEQYDQMFDSQGGRCAICGQAGKLGVDHAHDSGRVRALLCRGCSMAIGHMGEDSSRLRRAATYVDAYREGCDE